jgi:hypothetical protein
MNSSTNSVQMASGTTNATFSTFLHVTGIVTTLVTQTHYVWLRSSSNVTVQRIRLVATRIG